MLLHEFLSACFSPTCRCSDLSFIVGALKMEQDGEKEEVEEDKYKIEHEQ